MLGFFKTRGSTFGESPKKGLLISGGVYWDPTIQGNYDMWGCKGLGFRV